MKRTVAAILYSVGVFLTLLDASVTQVSSIPYQQACVPMPTILPGVTMDFSTLSDITLFSWCIVLSGVTLVAFDLSNRWARMTTAVLGSLIILLAAARALPNSHGCLLDGERIAEGVLRLFGSAAIALAALVVQFGRNRKRAASRVDV